MAGKGRNGNIERARQRDKARRRRHLELVRHVKHTVFGKCADCGTLYDPGNPKYHHFDHIVPEMKRGDVMRRLHNHGFRAFLNELPLVQLLCFPCHKAKTRRERRQRIKRMMRVAA